MFFSVRRRTKANPGAARWVLVAVILCIIALMWVSYSGSITATADAGGVTISYRAFPLLPRTTIQIAAADIQSTQVYDQAPPMHKTFGFAVGPVRVGSFTGGDIGSFKAYINATNRPLLLIRTKDQAYMISPEDASAMKQAIGK